MTNKELEILDDLEYCKKGLSVLERSEHIFNSLPDVNELKIGGKMISRKTFFKEIKFVKKIINKLQKKKNRKQQNVI